MSLRDQPASERIFATFIVLALAGAMALGLGFVATRELKPVPAAAQAPAHSRLIAVLNGVMAVNTNPSEVATFQTWVDGGATRAGWPPVETIVTNNCSSCHGDGGQYPRLTRYEEVQALALEPAPEGWLGFLAARPLHLFGFPALLLFLGLVYLRRIAWSGRKMLLALSVGALAFDLIQWVVRQGGPDHRWAGWTGACLLALLGILQIGAVLIDLWRPRPN